MIYLLSRKFFTQASIVKHYTNATNQNFFQWSATTFLFLVKHLLAIGRGLFFRLHNSNCIGHFASLLRTPGEIMYTCMYTCMYKYFYTVMYADMYTCVIWYMRFYTIADQKQTLRHSSRTSDLRPPDQQDRPFLAT